MSKLMTVSFKLNGAHATVTVPPAITLQKVLREGLKLTGTKNGCGEGECGACTILFDGAAINSCLIPVCQAEGRTIYTIEAFDDGSEQVSHPLLKAMVEHGAVQCGFCTPGVIMSAAGLLLHNPNPNIDDIKEALAGNLCRCTGYEKIFKAIQSVRSEFKLPVPVYKDYRCEINETDTVDVIQLKHLDELESLDLLDSWDLRFLSGGTDLMIIKNSHQTNKSGDMWIDLSKCKELSGIRLENGQIHIGAGTTWTELIHDAHVRQYAPALAQAASQVGSSQIRFKGTIGGNLANASPAGDSFPVLSALGAELITLNPDGVSRVISISDLVLQPGKTCLQVGECITEIVFPAELNVRSGFFKSVPRNAQALAKVSVAIAIKIEDNIITNTRIALGAVGPTVIRVENAEQYLIGQSVDSPGIDDIVSASIVTASPIDDFRSTKEYRERMIEVGIRRIMAELLQK